MQRRDALKFLAGVPAAAVVSAWTLPATAQVTRGFDQTLAAIANGEEIQRQPDLWVFEVQFKPMRMVYADITDPRSGQTTRTQVWYLAYRTVNRALAARQAGANTTPVNTLDPLPGPTHFLPEFTLLTYEQQGSEIPDATALDEVIPEATAAINRIERRRAAEPRFLNSVEMAQPLPDATPVEDTNAPWIYGVATWRNVDPETDFFTIVMRGFSNGYELREGPDGQPVVWRKAIIQKFTRRGDRFDPNQQEFELDGAPRWVYLPDVSGDAPGPGI